MNAYTGPVIDVDVHHRPKTAREIASYLPAHWRELVESDPLASPTLAPAGTNTWRMLENNASRADSIVEPGVQPGYSYEALRDIVMDPNRYYKAVLTYDVGEWSSLPNSQFAEAVCTAANTWTKEHWLPIDDRFAAVIAVATNNPAAAAREVLRHADDNNFVGVLFCGNGLGRPLGDPVYEPIYAAAVEAKKAITVHPGTDRPNTLTGSVGGPPSTTIEYISQVSQQAMHYVSSLLVNGVFERHPSLHFLIKEYGVTWLPVVMWRLDQEYSRLKKESPWIRRLPSEYIREHFSISTQPIEASPIKNQLYEFMAQIDGIDNMLCYSSDFPHYTMDQPSFIAKLFPAEWHRKIFYENACNVYGWALPEGGV